jgi:hypothetical protein
MNKIRGNKRTLANQKYYQTRGNNEHIGRVVSQYLHCLKGTDKKAE